MANQYFIKRNDKIRGPVSGERLRELHAEGKLKDNDLVSIRNDGGWKPLADLVGLSNQGQVSRPTPKTKSNRGSRKWMWALVAVFASLVTLVILQFATPDSPGSGVDEPSAQNVRAKGQSPATPVVAVARPKEAIVPFSEEQAKQFQLAWANYLRVPVEWTNSIGMKFRLIPPGKFVWPPGQPNEFILTDPYYLGVTEVTVGEFGQVMDFVFAEDKRHFPRADITAPEAIEFCDRLSAMEALKPGYRLAACPESEFAALGGREATWRPTDEEFGKIAWFDKNWDKEYHPVAQKLPSPFGIFDLYGNVWEFHDDKGGFRGLAAGNVAPSQEPSRFLSNYRFVNGPEFKERGVGFRVAIGLNVDDLKSNANGASLFADNRKDRDDAKSLPPVSVLRRAIEAYAMRDRSKVQRLASEADKARKTTEDEVTFRKVRHLLKLVEPPALKRLQELPPTTSECLVSDLVMDVEEGNLLLRNRSFTESPTASPLLTVAGQFFESGIFAHANSRLVLKLNGTWETLSTKYGIQDRSSESSVVFIVKGDGKELFRSSTVKPNAISDASVVVKGINDLELITETTSDGNRYDWSVWLEPTLHRNSQPSTSGTATSPQSPNSKSPASSTRSGIDVSSWGPSYGEVVEMMHTTHGASVGHRIDRTGRPIATIAISGGEAILTDDHLRQLSGLSGFIEVDLGYAKGYSTPGLQQLGRHKGLVSLRIHKDAGVSDEFLKSLEDSVSLQSLSIGGRRITDIGMSSLSRMSGLRELELTGCEITDAAMRSLASVKTLEELRLVACPIHGGGFTAFSGHDHLKVVELRLCKSLTADGVMELRHVRSLKEIQLTETTLPASVGEQLRKTRPDLLVNHSQVEPAMERILRQRVPIMDFPGNTPLNEVLDHITRSLSSFDDKLRFEFATTNRGGLSRSQSTSEQWNAVDIRILGGTLREALERILESVPNEDLTFSILDDAIVIRRR